MEKYPLVTVITPSYNQGQFIEATIQSILNQGYPNLEYIVVDGGSTDGTLDILRKYESQLTWISEKDNGQSDAINKGFRMAKGEIVAWLNSDDTYEPAAIHEAVDYFNDHKDVALVYGEGDIIDEFGNKVKRFEATQEFDLWTLIHVWDYIMQPASFFRREALERVDYLNVNLHWCMDWDLWIKLGSEYNVGYIPKVLANSREYAATKTSTGGWKRFSEIISLMRKYGKGKYPPGYFLYGTSTLYTYCENIPFFKLLAAKVMSLTHTITHRNLPIKYKDKWIGKKFSFSVPKQIRTIRIVGVSVFQEIVPFKITAYLDNREVASKIIENIGKFELQLDLNEVDEIQNVTLYINRYIIPSQFGLSSDQRKLSIIIDNIFWI